MNRPNATCGNAARARDSLTNAPGPNPPVDDRSKNLGSARLAGTACAGAAVCTDAVPSPLPTVARALHLHVLGSGSRGNCALVEGPQGLIMIDDGF